MGGRARRVSYILGARMRRLPLVFALLSPAMGVILLPRPVHAQPRMGDLVNQLKSNDDYRVRTQAALALGASGDDAAVKPLCDALGADANVAVKVAVAAALGKLGKPAGLSCLQTAGKKETTASVKTQIEKSITTLQSSSGAGSAAAPPPPGADTKWYVAIQVTNKTRRPAAEVDGIVRTAMQTKLLAKKGYAVAPKTESTSEGGQVVKAKKLKGFYLIATVDSPVYAGGNLTQTVHVAMLTYPDKSLQGDFSPKLTQSGTPKTDPASENELMKMCVENAIETFQKVVAAM